jgi:predicted anti-sigma-YlaC factor YlaD
MKLSEELTCAELVELVSDYLEDGPATRDRERFEEHLTFCDGCDVYFAQIRRTISVSGRLREEDLPDELEERLLTAFQGWKSS